jgi:iron complex outermembrane receptor protein
MFKRTKVCTGLMLAFGGTLTMSVAPALAQQTLERVEITGSNIRRVQSETASPVQVISREDIEKSGKATVGEYLQSLSVDNAGSVPSSFGNGFATGATAVSLRGLGAGSTLVLLNGRRMAPYGLADDGQKVFTDLSTIPMEAVERVEILKDGASAVYGSDAIAGVVNIILRKDFNGVVAKVSYGTSRYSDGNQKKAAITAGFGDLNTDRYNIFFNFEALKADEIAFKDRDRDWIGTADTRRWGYAQGGSFFTPGGAITGGGTVAGSSLVGNVRVPNVPPAAAGFHFVSLPGCAQTPTLTPADPGGGCLVDGQKLYGRLLPDQESYNFFTRGTLKLAGDMEGYAEFGYSKKTSDFQTTPSGVSGAWGFPGGPVNASSGPGAIVLAPTHPDNVVGGDRLRYLAGDVGPRQSHTDNDFYRAVVGLKGTFAGWDFDTAFLHSETKLVNQRNGYLRYSVAKAALGDPTSIYFPWRIGINSNLNSPALYAALAPTIQSDATSKMDIIDLKGSREMMQLPGGPLALAVGAEFRRESSELTPTTYTDIGDIIGLGYSAYSGKRNLFAAFAEVVAPIAKELEASAALRYDRYSGGLHSTTPKVGLKWVPVKTVALRGTYAEGFRAPNPAESGVGGLAAFTTAQDPVRCPGGVPAAGGGTAADCGQQIAIITTPDPKLKPEKSKSFTLGLVFEPTSSTSIAVDVWEIKRTNEINQTTAAQAIAGAGTVTRADNDLTGIPNSGTLLAVSAPYVNSASTKVKGLDLDLKQRFSLGDAGKLTATLVWTHIDSYKRTELDGTTFEFAGTHDNCDVTNCIGTVKDRFNFGLTWERASYQLSALVNYIGSIKNYASNDYVNCAHTFADGTDAPSGCKIPSFTTLDLSGRWSPTKNVEVFGSIQNLFDKVAPLDPTTYGGVNFNPLHVSGAIGRYYTVGLKYKFF